MTGGRDGVVTMWDPLFEQCLKAFKVEEASMNPGSVLLQNLPPVRALHTDEGKILIGTGNDEVQYTKIGLQYMHTTTALDSDSCHTCKCTLYVLGPVQMLLY